MLNTNINPDKIDFWKSNKWLIPIGVSNRHVHLSQEDIEILFGSGYKLTVAKQLVQKGNYAAKETVNVVGSKGVLEQVRIVGPPRNVTQVEISRTDAVKLGINTPIRDSGDLAETPGAILIGPNGPLVLKKGVIIPRAHIHMTKSKAESLDLNDKDKVSILIKSQKVVCYHNVLVRVTETGETEFHMDTDEANAAFVDTGDLAMIKHREMVIKDNFGNIVEVGVDNIKFVLGKNPHDYACIEGIKLLRNIFHYPTSIQQSIVNKMLNTDLIEPNRFYLLSAMEEDRVVGISCFYYLKDSKLGYLEHLGIIPEYRNRGIGSFLYHKVTSFLEKEHPEIEGLLLEVRCLNDETDNRKQLFLNLGAIPVDTSFYPSEKFKFAEELLLMFKPLVVEANLNTVTLEQAFRSLAKVL
ncbi:phosphate propanoyltransferase [Phosphitispora sp. TUW77]|uniref:phosphate propanoyltransferase n=1 Tax=Phosphitispora sp. TUW77 TaxID=3152361 RepID=UPI003AB25376